MTGVPIEFPGIGHHHRHGTRARYVVGCRCSDCRAANAAAYHERQRRAKAAALEHATAAPVTLSKPWTAPDGSTRLRIYRAACPGVEGSPCPKQRHLRKDSIGGLCADCRGRLVWNGLVEAAPARRHLRRLSRQGVGYKAVSDACDVGKTTLFKIIAGTKPRIRKASADRFLAVTREAVADHGLVPAARTQRMLRELEAEYFTKAGVAKLLGYKSPALQIGHRRVLARTELRVSRIYRRVTGRSSCPPAPCASSGCIGGGRGNAGRIFAT